MNWAIFALMFPHLKPKCIKFFSPIFYRVWDGFRVLSLLILVFLFVRRFTKDKKLPSPVSWVIGVLEGWICLNTLIKHGDYVEVFSLAVSGHAGIQQRPVQQTSAQMFSPEYAYLLLAADNIGQIGRRGSHINDQDILVQQFLRNLRVSAVAGIEKCGA